ncbi:RRM_XMAS2 and SAC3_GANP domain-containing protein xmas [Haematobia irritans]|uniref:RRM_XMAS2 and SAC3_GANP domain-containing protein xmas n=1 Tax=Haematobia irritans TaxID=7368 RepID=UPI003F4FCF03
MSEDGEYETNDDNTNYKAISCEKIPELFLDKLVAKKHFSKFGKISRFILKPNRLSCTVEYETEEDAERAYMEAGEFNGLEFDVNYAAKQVAQVQSTEEWVDPDVQSELEAMSPGHHRAFGSAANSGTQMKSVFGAAPQVTTKSLAFARLATKQTPQTISAPKPILRQPTPRNNSPIPDTPKIDASVRSELEAILRRPALSDEDKYRVLDARDKLIRLTTIRQTDIKKAVATKGTCPDMCPEKERLMREFQRQVSTFEMASDGDNTQSTISHRKAIKEYSRSSADQEVPLSHELRSESVLQMTMLYLMHRIMDLCEDPQTSLADWFHFVWDRTRSIRKDITQQELCSVGGVQLVEQCARFHIHCAARLVAEDPSVFDKKINAENLTKCLQTLKYLYHDLRIKGIQCPCEAEFRSYIILLNLGDSNFLWELKQLPVNIQKAGQIKRAIAFYNALQNNNYVRFFSMIRSEETSYMEACILLGYFNKLRLRAMEVIIKSHNWRKNDVFLPLSYLTHVLGFDDESSAVNFLSYHGLQCDELEDRVLLERMSMPDMEYAMDRALKLVESKRQVSVGECVCGQVLPSPSTFEQHQPHSSFDANGLLKAEAWSANDQLRGDEAYQSSFAKPQTIEPVVNPIQTSFLKPPESNIFKMPQASPPVSPKQQQRKMQQQPESAKSIFGSVSNNKEEIRSSSPGGFKFGGNIFGGSTNSSNTSASSNFKPAQESIASSIFKLPSGPPEQKNNSSTSIFKANTENALPVSGNIFGGFMSTENKTVNSASIFGNAAKETANIFQQANKPSNSTSVSDPFKNDNVFQHFQAKPDGPIFGGFASNASSNSLFAKPINTFSQTPTVQEMEERKMQLEREHELKQKQLEEEKRKLKELEEKRMREKQQQEEQRKREIEMKRKEAIREMCLQKASQELEAILASTLQQELQSIAHEEFNKFQLVQQASRLQTDLLLQEVIEDIVEDIAHVEYALMCHDQLLLNRYFNRWLMHLRKKREQRKLMESTPLWVTTDSRAQFAHALDHPCKETNLELIKRYRMGQPCNFKQLMQMSSQADDKPPLCLFTLISRHLLAKENLTPAGLLQQRQYFKLLISIPADEEELPGFETYCNKWLFKHINKAQLETGPFVHGLLHQLALCVRKLSGIHCHNEQGDVMKNEGDHSDGIVCFISGEEFASQARKRLYNILYNSKNYKKLPVAIIAYNCLIAEHEIIDLLDLESLEDEGLLCKFKIFGNGVSRKDFNFRKVIRDAINYITIESYNENNQDIQALAMENILSFLDSTLGEEIFLKLQDSAMKNPVFQKICQQPQHVEGIYDKALKQLLQITQEDFSEMPEFPEELKEFVPQHPRDINIPLGLEFFPSDWKNNQERKMLKSFLQKLHLPSLKRIPSPPSSNVEDLEMWILNYASLCLPHDDMGATKAAHYSISNLIEQLKQPALDTMAANEKLKHLNYLPILKPIIFAHINRILQEFSDVLKNVPAIYFKNNLQKYLTQPWWLNYQPLDLVNMDYSQMEDKNKNNSPPSIANDDYKENNNLSEQLDNIIAQAEATSLRVEKNLLAIKEKNSKRLPAPNAECLQLKRTLDESLYKFELSKRIGQYDNSYITELTQDIDNTINEVLTSKQSLSSPDGGGPSKRKRISMKSPLAEQKTSTYSDIDKVIERARKLIEKVENMDDGRNKRGKSQIFQ